MEEEQWGAFGVAQPLEGAGRERGAAYLPLQVGGDVSDLDLSAPAKTKPGLRSREGSDCRRLSGSKMVRP